MIVFDCLFADACLTESASALFMDSSLHYSEVWYDSVLHDAGLAVRVPAMM